MVVVVVVMLAGVRLRLPQASSRRRRRRRIDTRAAPIGDRRGASCRTVGRSWARDWDEAAANAARAAAVSASLVAPYLAFEKAAITAKAKVNMGNDSLRYEDTEAW